MFYNSSSKKSFRKENYEILIYKYPFFNFVSEGKV